MIDSGPTAADRAYVEAMRSEVDWAPLYFNGWGHYEQARPMMPGETIEVLARWPDNGYTLQYRPLLGELTEARQYPIDSFPTVTVLGGSIRRVWSNSARMPPQETNASLPRPPETSR